MRENSVAKLTIAESYLYDPLKNDQLWYYKSLIYARLWEYARAEMIVRDILKHAIEASLQKSSFELLWDIQSLHGEQDGSGQVRILAFQEALGNYQVSERIESLPRIQQKIKILKSLIGNEQSEIAEAKNTASAPMPSKGSWATSSPTLSRDETKTLNETRDTLEEYQKVKQKFLRLVGETTEDEAMKDLWGSLLPSSSKKSKEDW